LEYEVDRAECDHEDEKGCDMSEMSLFADEDAAGRMVGDLLWWRLLSDGVDGSWVADPLCEVMGTVAMRTKKAYEVLLCAGEVGSVDCGTDVEKVQCE